MSNEYHLFCLDSLCFETAMFGVLSDNLSFRNSKRYKSTCTKHKRLGITSHVINKGKFKRFRVLPTLIMVNTTLHNCCAH